MTTQKECPDCRGKGKRYISFSRHYGKPEYEKCPTCGSSAMSNDEMKELE